jgi:two-component system chemotaxis response regulator CheB
MEAMGAELVKKLKAAAGSKKPKLAPKSPLSPKRVTTSTRSSVGLILIAASTGGTVAIRQLLEQFPTEIPPTLIVQHMPPYFSRLFAEHLRLFVPFLVREAVDGEPVLPNQVLIAPGGRHMEVVGGAGSLKVKLSDGPEVNHSKPSADVLFESIPRKLAPDTVGVILTGMGSDGARGLLGLRQAGAHTIAQDEATCLIYGMPRAAAQKGAAVEVIPLDEMGSLIWSALARPSRKAA